mmetsp:Transcript_101326/g.180088  ORF Transcript_101326/g.180088 Transcript_101326/m.180088 type:complete len:260 (-) Transcript_101326:60-839(-)
MDRTECSRCRVDYYHNSEVRVYFSQVCDHRVCERCLPEIRGKMCPGGCGKRVRADDFSEQPRAREVESELKVRRQIGEIYCKMEQDFPSADDWNEYLVMREDIIYTLANQTSQDEVQEARRQIEQYKEENAEHILRAQSSNKKRVQQKVESIIKEEGAFASRVNADWQDRDGLALQHSFQAQYKDLLELSPPPEDAAVTPPLAPQPLFYSSPSPVQKRVSKARQMSGGGQAPDLSSKKARHFFFLDLAQAARRAVAVCP